MKVMLSVIYKVACFWLAVFMEKFAAQHAYFLLHFFSPLPLPHFSSPLPTDFIFFTSIFNIFYYRQPS